MSLLFPGCRVTAGITEDATFDGLNSFPWTSFTKEETSPASCTANTCPECLTDAWVQTEDEETVCLKCGTFLGYSITSSAEYRWFGSDDRNPDPSRVGNPMNPLMPESSLGTRIVARPGEHRSMRKIRQYHLWNVMPYRERTLWNVFEMLQVRASNAGISGAIVEETKQLYAQVSPLCICRGQQKDALMGACMFESLKRHDTPRRPQEIADIFQVSVKLITRAIKQFSGLLDEHLHATARGVEPTRSSATKAVALVSAEPTATSEAINTSNTPPPPLKHVILAQITSPSTNFKHFLEPAILRLETPRGMLHTMSELAEHFGDTLDELGVCPETTPPSLAACALTLACQHLQMSKTPSEVATVCGISVATLQKCMKRIEPWKPTIFKNLNK